MNEYMKKTSSPEETMDFATKLGQYLKPGTVLTLEGDLGAGKTHFTKGLAKGLGVKRVVNSPTFTIIKEYKGKMPLYHMDVYRLDDSSEDIGLDEYFYGEGLTVVEWASRIQEQLPKERLEVEIFRVGDTERKIVIRPIGAEFEQLCEEIIV
ncbi:ATP-binding protein [Alkalihalobacillus alcalophilus ATCC 27647 = CGMCC 1.3604]|uniref:tRNA threonylcarbamoyladenosine biosynthesis protein TsaE n=1 Tax=Alkalihalobacillus alcalophilus ATCC 27647 = CGMCC 1.3604 TaxID=1218173 RepID=A0A094WJ32_ALKAL|nr:tRNA (adenosine(37)-N6)-threonylcarbamoyltransferase complex ATPase subunit type 1 TsaE [Alkalihalobacillus alcalophilus]KGA97774.1 ATP-binding protein [Alkalihalobacillus alcalophilus ATCC 27647 = CGMCC 1.3604]MED1562463.1 tRNA (adenosine(37)-N6)-threonylcarbamoyltransferase complex ATPase subunit type 1 TsaE [Alkalihalobacillus alcalophilus]THG90760.1 ATP-binding protein [Alkalihalobacillus alcalophilus ATCC 27647 = CGMCC 1.3604]